MNRLKVVSIALFLASAVLTGVFAVRNLANGKLNGPVLSIEGETLEVSVEDDEKELLRGVTAADEQDGDVTDSVFVESIGDFDENMQRTVIYAVCDSDNNVTKAERKITYSDYVKPQFIVKKPFSYVNATTNFRAGLSARDCIDGDVTSLIRLTSEEGIDSIRPGNYSAELKVTNSAGDTSILPVTIEIYNIEEKASLPVIALSDYVVYIPVGSSFDAAQYLDSLRINGISYGFTKGAETYGTDKAALGGGNNTVKYDRIATRNDVDTKKPGNYTVQYTFSDAEYGTGTTTLYVVVTEGGAK